MPPPLSLSLSLLNAPKRDLLATQTCIHYRQLSRTCHPHWQSNVTHSLRPWYLFSQSVEMFRQSSVSTQRCARSHQSRKSPCSTVRNVRSTGLEKGACRWTEQCFIGKAYIEKPLIWSTSSTGHHRSKKHVSILDHEPASSVCDHFGVQSPSKQACLWPPTRIMKRSLWRRK